MFHLSICTLLVNRTFMRHATQISNCYLLFKACLVNEICLLIFQLLLNPLTFVLLWDLLWYIFFYTC